MTSPNQGPVQIQISAGWQRQFIPGVKKLLDELGNKMVSESRDIVAYNTGFLSESIEYHIDDRADNGQFTFPSLVFGATADYSSSVEFGHATPGGGFVEAQPFLRPVAYKYRNGIG
jgi:hypothetical protein